MFGVSTAATGLARNYPVRGGSEIGWAGAVRFQAERGAPVEITLDAPPSRSESADAGVRYFSGTGTST